MKHRLGTCLLLAALFLLIATPGGAASIPAWLDDAITEWNGKNPETPIQFVDIKDSFVWYVIPQTPEIGHQKVRESIYGIVLEHGYKMTADEELVTTGKPPTQNAPYRPKKCWRRSFVKDIEELSNTTTRGGGASGMTQRMLTSMVCEDVGSWYAGFRILQ